MASRFTETYLDFPSTRDPTIRKTTAQIISFILASCSRRTKANKIKVLNTNTMVNVVLLLSHADDNYMLLSIHNVFNYCPWGPFFFNGMNNEHIILRNLPQTSPSPIFCIQYPPRKTLFPEKLPLSYIAYEIVESVSPLYISGPEKFSTPILYKHQPKKKLFQTQYQSPPSPHEIHKFRKYNICHFMA